MLINEIPINQYWAYQRSGNNLFDLRPKKTEREVILMWWKNGSGKTTLLNAIKPWFIGTIWIWSF